MVRRCRGYLTGRPRRGPPVRRFMLTLLGLLLLGAVLLAADLAVTMASEERLSQRVSDALDATADVELHGWPVTAYLATGTLPGASASATDVPIVGTDGTIERLDVMLADVAVRWSDLTGQAEDLPRADVAEFEAHVDQATAQALIGLPDQIARVDLRDGAIALDVAGGATIDAHLEAQDGIVVVLPSGDAAGLAGLAEIPIDLRDQPGGPHVHEVTVTEGGVVLTGTLTEVATAGG
jgi:hypothetical protein